MRVKLRDEGRIFEGTASQVVQQMQRTAIFAAHLSLSEYLEWCVQNAAQLGVTVKLSGETTEDRCASLVDELVTAGLAERL